VRGDASGLDQSEQVLRFGSELDELRQCCRETWIRELVANPAAFGRRGHQTATPQTGEVVRDIGLGEAELLGQLRRIAGTIEQPDQEPASCRVGQRGTDAAKGVEISHGCEHRPIVQRWLNHGNPLSQRWGMTPSGRCEAGSKSDQRP
jgi:hypothetical protein